MRCKKRARKDPAQARRAMLQERRCKPRAQREVVPEHRAMHPAKHPVRARARSPNKWFHDEERAPAGPRPGGYGRYGHNYGRVAATTMVAASSPLVIKRSAAVDLNSGAGFSPAAFLLVGKRPTRSNAMIARHSTMPSPPKCSRRFLDSKIIDAHTGFDHLAEPPRLFSPTCPGLCRLRGILKFGQNLWVSSTLARWQR